MERDEMIVNFIRKKGKTCSREIADKLDLSPSIVPIRLRALKKWGDLCFEKNPNPQKGDDMSRAYKWWSCSSEVKK